MQKIFLSFIVLFILAYISPNVVKAAHPIDFTANTFVSNGTASPEITLESDLPNSESAQCELKDSSNDNTVDNNAFFSTPSKIILGLAGGAIPNGWAPTSQYYLQCIDNTNKTVYSNDFRYTVAPDVKDVIQNANLIDVYFSPDFSTFLPSDPSVYNPYIMLHSPNDWFDDLFIGDNGPSSCEPSVYHNAEFVSVCHFDLLYNPQLPFTDEATFNIGVGIDGVNYGVEGFPSFSINSLAPSVNITDHTVYVGELFEAIGSFMDNYSNAWTATIDYGDGTGLHPLALDGYNFELSHVYSASGTYFLSIYITDDDGNAGSSFATITVLSNTAPSISSIQLSPNQVNTNENIAFSSSFNDPEIGDTHTATIDWGDGNTSEGTATEANGEGIVEGTHQYSNSGTYTVTVTVTDNHNASDVDTASVEVLSNDPVILYPSADSYIKEGGPNQNEGASTFLRIQSSGHNRALIKFDQSQIQSAIGSAQNYTASLQLTISDNGNNWGSTGRDITVHRIFQDWLEGTGSGAGVTWNCSTDSNVSNSAANCTGSDIWEMTTTTLWPFAAAATATTTITNNQSGVVSFDVTSDVQSFISGANQNYGWVIKKVNEGQNGKVEFGSKESGSSPQLVITFN